MRDDIQFRIALGNVRYREGRFAEAESEYRTVLKASQRNVEALNGLGLVLARTEQRDEAIGALERAQRISPLHPVTAYNLAVLYQGKGDNQEAIRQYKIAIEQGSHFEANLQLGMLMLHLARLDESEQYLSNAATLRSDDANVLRTMARLYDRMRDYDKAEQALRRALAIEEADSESWLNLGVVLINKRQEGVAEQALSKAIKLDPKNAQALTALGWAQIELGKYAEAEDSLKQALALDASNALARNNLGVLFERQGRLDDARLELERALKLDPDLELAQRNMERLK